MSPKEAERLRKTIGAVLLAAAVIVWTTALVMSPHSEPSAGAGSTHFSASVARFIGNSALGTLILTMAAAALLFWRQRPRKRFEDVVVVALLIALAATSLYQMVWIDRNVFDVETQGPMQPEEI